MGHLCADLRSHAPWAEPCSFATANSERHSRPNFRVGADYSGDALCGVDSAQGSTVMDAWYESGVFRKLVGATRPLCLKLAIWKIHGGHVVLLVLGQIQTISMVGKHRPPFQTHNAQ